MAIRRGYSYITAVVPTKLKKWVTRKARQESVSRSRLLTRILTDAERSEQSTTSGGS
jgi:hypothetical protein